MTDINFQIGDKIFQWYSNKVKRNKIKHNVSFKVAARVFEDENRIEFFDNTPSDEEDRWQVIGKVENILVVIYTERGDITRIISARKATEQEREIYNVNSDLYFT